MKTKDKIVIIVILAVLCILLTIPLSWREPSRIDKDPSMKYLLLWTSPSIEPLSLVVKGQETFVKRDCPVKNCYATANRELLKDLTDFDVVLFHMPEIFRKTYYDMPERRSPMQIYVFTSMESAAYYPAPKRIYDNYFNMTWTYKLDSDLCASYMTIRNDRGEIIGPKRNINWLKFEEMLPLNETLKIKLKRKDKPGAWFVSNCKAPSNRDELMRGLQEKLSEYDLSIDIYGSCGSKRCPRNKMDQCLKSLENEYYFYFALENSLSPDYVTEKLLHALNNYAVPVVFGGADYNRFMPDGIYLDASKLTLDELAQEIAFTMNDKDKFFDYFRWHNHYSYQLPEKSPKTDPFCKLCEYVHKWNGTKVVGDLAEWWNQK